MCVACGRRAPQGELLRLGLSQGRVVPDPDRRLPGRGAYLCRRRECAEALARDSRRSRVFRRPLGPEAWRDLFRELKVNGG